MKPERIGASPRDQLRWVLRVVERRLPRSEANEGDWLNLEREIQEFAGFPFPGDWGAPLTRLEENLTDIVKWLHSTVMLAVDRREINVLPRPDARRLIWNKSAQRYEQCESRLDDNFVFRIHDKLGRLIESHGHLLKQCTSPAKMRPGRRPKDGPANEPAGECGNLFLASRDTEIYCSPACRSRVVSRRKRARPKGKKKHKPK